MLLEKIWALVFSICICYLAYPKDTSLGPKSAKFEFPQNKAQFKSFKNSSGNLPVSSSSFWHWENES